MASTQCNDCDCFAMAKQFMVLNRNSFGTNAICESFEELQYNWISSNTQRLQKQPFAVNDWRERLSSHFVRSKISLKVANVNVRTTRNHEEALFLMSSKEVSSEELKYSPNICILLLQAGTCCSKLELLTHKLLLSDEISSSTASLDCLY